MTKTIEFSWTAWLSQADPDWLKEKTREIEYEFTARGLPLEPTGDDREYADGMRVFRANPERRGPYAEGDLSDEAITWGTLGVLWDDDQLTWEDE